jgi:hypothetical protein
MDPHVILGSEALISWLRSYAYNSVHWTDGANNNTTKLEKLIHFKIGIETTQN